MEHIDYNNKNHLQELAMVLMTNESIDIETRAYGLHVLLTRISLLALKEEMECPKHSLEYLCDVVSSHD